MLGITVAKLGATIIKIAEVRGHKILDALLPGADNDEAAIAALTDKLHRIPGPDKRAEQEAGATLFGGVVEAPRLPVWRASSPERRGAPTRRQQPCPSWLITQEAMFMGTEPAWLLAPRAKLGTREAAGSANNPIFMSWAKRRATKVLGIAYNAESVPWCGVFVAACLAEDGIPAAPIAIRAKA